MNSQSLKAYFQKPEFGLLIVRAGMGVIMAIYGLNKFRAGEDELRGVGSAISHLGLPVTADSVLALLLGVLAAGGELIGGILLVLGLWFRPAAAVLLFTMVVALVMKIGTGGAFNDFAHPLSYALVFAGLMFTGPGRMGLQKA